jgi:heme oxygenase (mycobilin-producing)
MKVISLLECRFKPECIEAGTEWLTRALAATRAFDGCLGVEVIQDSEDPVRLIAVERWASLEHDQAYRAWRAAEGRIKEGEELFEGPRKLTVGILLDEV